jgi:hypothetical protein
VSVALSSTDVEGLKSLMDEEGINSRSEAARELIQEGIANRVTPEEAAKRKRERVQMYGEALDSLYGRTGPMREAAIQKLLADKTITEEMARELAKPTRKR